MKTISEEISQVSFKRKKEKPFKDTSCAGWSREETTSSNSGREPRPPGGQARSQMGLQTHTLLDKLTSQPRKSSESFGLCKFLDYLPPYPVAPFTNI